MSTLAATIARNLVHYRELRGLSQFELAKKAGIARQTISRYERPGGYVGVTLSNLVAIAKALEIDEIALIADGVPPKPVSREPDLLDAIRIVRRAFDEVEAGGKTPLLDALVDRAKKKP